MKLKEKKGITLVALVVTIIVLIILAGVSVNLVLGEKGILTKTREARNNYEVAANEEQKNLSNIKDEIDIHIGAGLSVENVAKVNEKLKTSLMEVNYEPATTEEEVIVEATYNGGVADQTFTQANTIGTDANKMKWYVLSANESEVKLVSSVSNKAVTFKDSAGYDNCLYYLNEIATTYDENSIKTYHPVIYQANASGVVETNNPFYDETPGTKITDSGIKRNETGNPTTTLKVKYTHLSTTDNATILTNLGSFGTSNIGKELFNESGTNYWLASRCVVTDSSNVYYRLRHVNYGNLGNYTLCLSDGSVSAPSLRLSHCSFSS